MIVPVCTALLIGMLVGRLFHHYEERCPRVISGQYCKGAYCDHSDSLRYEALMQEALERERFNGGGGYV